MKCEIECKHNEDGFCSLLSLLKQGICPMTDEFHGDPAVCRDYYGDDTPSICRTCIECLISEFHKETRGGWKCMNFQLIRQRLNY